MVQIRAKGGTLLGGPTELIRRMLAQGSKSMNQRTRHLVSRQDLGRKARVLAVVHGWMPYLAAGSERMMQHMLDALPREEFDVAVLSFGFGGGDEQGDYIYEGTPVHVGYTAPFVPDVIITHHGPAARVVQDMAADHPEARVVTVYHNERYDIPDIQDCDGDLEVYNTKWVRAELGSKRFNPSMVVHPPLELDRHSVTATGDRVTLVNLQENKGVRVFHALADRMAGVQFLGVEGTHGQQEYRRDLPNIEYMRTTQDMRDVWSRSKIVLMPSGYESFGMVAAEACVNGIPVLAHPTPGLVECLGDAGLFLDRDDVPAWERTVHLLLTDPEQYRVASERASLRARELASDSRSELHDFVENVRKLV